MTAGDLPHNKRQPPPGSMPLGKNLEEVKVFALAATFVIQRAAAHCAHQLAGRIELNERDRLTAFDAFVDALIEEARKAPLDGFLEDDEAGGKEILRSFIRRVAGPPRMRLMAG